MKDKRRHIDPLEILGPDLLGVEKPARYLGGELGSLPREGDDADLVMALCFPDLYEIGMSNNAIRILYSSLNALEHVRCERVFAPAPDFEELLAKKKIPLHTLEGGLPLSDVDILGFTLGYELAATSVVLVLQSGQVPILVSDRGEEDPIVIMGGPAISNPHPFSRFIDAAYIGEAEASFEAIMADLALMKRKGAKRQDLLLRLAEDPSVWMPQDRKQNASRGEDKPSRVAIRAVYKDFPSRTYHTAFPVATVKTVQDHGTVEIMRGCPNGCRFCHAGYYYRPQRFKPYGIIRQEVAELVTKGGYREITLSSLSSGDYPGIETVLDSLNREWGREGVSFQLPSLKINTFTLPLLEKLSEVRKSGLTFAVETPDDAWQRIINKDVSFEQTVSILEAAKAKGFKLAKFYFMIGLPVPGGAKEEAKAIIEFFERLIARVQIQLNVNVGTFVPKPHTPFQWCAQLSEDEALEAIHYMKDRLRSFRSLKLSYHSPFVSLLEGVISRGDERVGELILEAYRRGARLDAWEDHFNRDLWKAVLAEAGWPVLEKTMSSHTQDDVLIWDDIKIRVGKNYLWNEYQKALDGIFTSKCMDSCKTPCGSCSDELKVVQFGEHVEAESPESKTEGPAVLTDPCKIVFSFNKTGRARYYPHLSISECFNRAFQMLRLPIKYSEGFNPLPRLELIQPLPIGYGSDEEFGSLQLLRPILSSSASGQYSVEELVSMINGKLPEGLAVREIHEYPIIPGKKIHSLMSLSWGSKFIVDCKPEVSAARLAERLSGRICELGIKNATATRLGDGDSLEVILPDPKSKDAGLMKLLEASMEERPVQAFLGIRRSTCLATLGDSGTLGFFQAFDQLSK